MNERCGFWVSEITPKDLAKAASTLQEIHAGKKGVFWTESRPEEEGRSALIDPFEREVAPQANVRSRVHEYGGGAFGIHKEKVIFFDVKKGALFLKEGETLRTVVQDPSLFFADFTFSLDGKKVVCVCEKKVKGKDPENFLALIDLQTNQLGEFAKGKDFYAAPQFSPDGKKLGFLSWDIAQMSWDECHLFVVDLEGHILFKKTEKGESISQFCWTSEEEIVFSSDRSGFWNLYVSDLRKERALCKEEADFCYPIWVLGRKNFVLVEYEGEKGLFCFYTEKGVDRLGVVLLKSGELIDLHLPFTSVISVDVDGEGKGYFIGGSAKEPLGIFCFDFKTKKYFPIRKAAPLNKSIVASLAEPEKIQAVSSVDKGAVYALYYPPRNQNYTLQEKPPLMVKCHSGPTSHSPLLFSLQVQFWTSRGFGFLDVNYRGSTGFGREYRKKLDGKWGELDALDVADVIADLIAKEKVSSQAVFARGSSSGGLTALTLAMSGKIKGCISAYGVTDLNDLEAKTHKFEKSYLDTLVGKKELYAKRSPLANAKKIKCPVLFLHGEEDPVVPVEQAKNLSDELSDSEILLFPGERHGLKKSITIETYLSKELQFCQEKI